MRHAAGSVGSNRGRPAARPADVAGRAGGPLRQAVSTHTRYITFIDITFIEVIYNVNDVISKVREGLRQAAPPARRHPPRTCRRAVEPDRARGAGDDPCQAGNGG